MAGQQQVTIHFKAKGGRALKTVVDQLYLSIVRIEKGEKKWAAATRKLGRQQKKLDKRLGKSISKTRLLSGSLAVLRSKLLIASFGMAMLVEPIKRMSAAAGDATEILNKSTVVFGANIDIVREWAGALGESVGRAESTLLKMASALQDTFFPLGYTREAATQLSTSLTTLAIDVASFSNKVDADVLQDFQSAIIGNHKTVRKYGVVITESILRQEAFNLGLIDTFRRLTENEKIQARISLIMKGSADATGDAERTAHEYTQTVVRFGESWKKAFETIGGFLIPIMKLSMKFFNPRRVVTYATVIGIASAAWVVHKLAIKLADFELKKFKLNLIVTTGGLFLLAVVIAEIAVQIMGMNDELSQSGREIEELEAQMKEASDATVGFAGDNELLTEQILKGKEALQQEITALGNITEFQKMAHKITKDRIGGIANLSYEEDAYISILADHKETLSFLSEQQGRNLSHLKGRKLHLANVAVAEQKLITIQHFGLLALTEKMALENDMIVIQSNKRAVTHKEMVTEKAKNQVMIDGMQKTWEKSKKFWAAHPDLEKAHINKMQEYKTENKALDESIKANTELQMSQQEVYAKTLTKIEETKDTLADLQSEYESLDDFIVKTTEAQLKQNRWKKIGDQVHSVTEPMRRLSNTGIDMMQVMKDLGDTFINVFETGRAGNEKWADDLQKKKFLLLGLKEMAIEATFALAGAVSDMYANVANAAMDTIRREYDARIEAMKKEKSWKKKNQKQKDAAIKEEEKGLAAQLKSQFEKKQDMARIGVILDTAAAIMVAYKDERGSPTNHVLAALAGAAGIMQLATINSQQAPKMGIGGIVGGLLHSQGGTMIEAEKGEFVMSRDAVDSIGVETMNKINSGGGAGNISISFSGNVMSDDFIENEAIPKIRNAIRRGSDIGIS